MPAGRSHESARRVRAFHGRRRPAPDPPFERELSLHLRACYGRPGLEELYGRFAFGEGGIDRLLRRAVWRALAARFGDGVRIAGGVTFRNPETFRIGSGVFIGAQSVIQGRHDGRCVIGDHAWIGPMSFLDARDLVIEDGVGWGPGAMVLGSRHTGRPLGIPIIRTDLEIRPVRIRAGADIGMNAVILPGVTVGRGSIVGAGAVVTHDVPPYTVVAGVPARVLRTRRRSTRP